MHDEDLTPRNHPYEEGKTLILSVNEALSPKKHTVKVRILRNIQPNTLSCVLEVDVLDVNGPVQCAKRAILKLYDWRYATQLRQDYRMDPWLPHHENMYRTFVEEGGAAKFLSALELEDDDSIDDNSWDTAQNETFLFDYCRDLHGCEVEAYSRLKDLQGRFVPQFFADLRLQAGPAHNDFFEVRGILLELITGYSLADLARYAPQSSWQRICDETIRTINLISDQGILNEDVKPRNILIRPRYDNLWDGEVVVVVIDFALCKFRETDQSEAAWKHEKCRQDEEGAIGYVMAHKLNGAITYSPSYRFRCTCTKCRDV